MAVIQYLDKRGLKTLVKEITKRTTQVYVVKGSAIYADSAYLASDTKETGITSTGLWQNDGGTWKKITEVQVGWVYNIINSFTTDADFIEGAGNKVEGGTNIVVASVGTGNAIKWDLLAMSLSLDTYQTKKLLAAIDVFTAGTSTPIKVTALATAPAAGTPADPAENDVVIVTAGTDKDNVYRYNGTAWVKIGDQVTVEGSLELLSKVAPNTPISDAEIIAAFAEVETD